MKRACWKRREREVAELLGGVRTGVTGTQTNDVRHPTLAVEVKARGRGKLPKLVTDAAEQARTAHTARGRLPVVFLIEEGRPLHKGLVVAQLEDVEAWLSVNDADAIQRAWDRHLDRENETLQEQLHAARSVIAQLQKKGAA